MAEIKFGVKKSGDPNTKYGKFIIYQTQPHPPRPSKEPEVIPRHLDDRVIKGGFYWSGLWINEAEPPDREIWKPHYHDYPEYLGMFGTNPEDPTDLCGEVEFWFDDEKHIITNSCMLFIPPGLSHCPYLYRRVDRPIFAFSCSPASILYAHINHDPKWNHLKDHPKSDTILD
jgi:hypothetical protein